MGSHARFVLAILIFLGVLCPAKGYTRTPSGPSVRPLVPLAAAQDSLTRRDYLPDRWAAPDKWQHFLVSLMGTVFVGKWAEEHWNWSAEKSRGWSVGLTISLGVAKEVHDSRQPRNHFCWKDLTADLAGVAVGVVLLSF